MVIYNVQSNGECNQLVIELINDTVFIDPDSVAYVTGNINLDVSDNTTSNRFKSWFVGKSLFKPKFQGTGKIYLYATLGSYHKFALKDNEELFINPNIFMACRDSVQLIPHVNITLENFFSGVPMVNLLVKGTGSVMVLMSGPVQEVALNGEKFVAIGSEIAAYSSTLKTTREIVCKNWLTDQKMARIFRGSGSVFFSPIPNKDSKSKTAK